MRTIIYLIIWIAFYCFTSYCIMGIMERLGSPRPRWWAWVPFLNTYALWELSDTEIIWFILTFICMINFVAIVIILMPIAEKCGYDRVWGIYILIPFFNFYVMWKLGYGQ